MAVKLKTTMDQHSDGVKCVIYGASGVGKTVLSSTAPAPIILSAEKGLLSLSGKDIPYVEIFSIADLDEAYRYVKTSDFKTVILDSLSEIAEVVVNEYKKSVKDPRQAYGQLADSVTALIRNFRDLKGKNVVFNAKMRRIEDDDGVISFEPYFPGKILPFQLPYLVDEVFCMRIDLKGNRIIQTISDRRYTCKDRSGKLAAQEEPNLTKLFEKIIGVNKNGNAS